MKPRFSGILCIATILGLGACSESPTEPALGTLVATVLDAVNAPVAGATVSLSGIAPTVTSAAGTVTFSEIGAGHWTLFIDVEGLETLTSRVTVTANDTTYHVVNVDRGTGWLKVRVSEAWDMTLVPGAAVQVFRKWDQAPVWEGLTNSAGQTTSVELPVQTYSATVVGPPPLLDGAGEIEVTAGAYLQLRVDLERTYSEFAGTIDFDSNGHISQGNYVGLWYAEYEGGSFTVSAEPSLVQDSYFLSTQTTGFLVVLAQGNPTDLEFSFSASEVYDCTGGHLADDVPVLLGGVNSASPTDFADFDTYTQIPLKCDRDISGVAASVWYVYRWYQDSNLEWQWEEVWWQAHAPGNINHSWDAKVNAAPEGEVYSWIAADYYNDGRWRVTWDYFFMLHGFPGNTSSAMRQGDVGERLRMEARRSVPERALASYWSYMRENRRN